MSHEQGRRVVALVSGSHFVNHAYMVLLAPLVGVLAARFDVGIAAIGLAIGVPQAGGAPLATSVRLRLG